MVWPQSGCCLSGTTSVDRVIGSGPGIRSSVVDCQPPVSGRASESRVASVAHMVAQWASTEHAVVPLGELLRAQRLESWRRQTTTTIRYQHVNNRFSNDWRVEKSNTFPHRVGAGVLYEPKAFAIAPSFTNAIAPFALPAMLGGAMSLFTPISLEAGGGARKIF